MLVCLVVFAKMHGMRYLQWKVLVDLGHYRERVSELSHGTSSHPQKDEQVLSLSLYDAEGGEFSGIVEGMMPTL